MRRTRKRSLIKALTYRVICSGETFLLAWWFLGSWKAGGLLSAILFIVKTITYFTHERVWEWVEWGKYPRRDHSKHTGHERDYD